MGISGVRPGMASLPAEDVKAAKKEQPVKPAPKKDPPQLVKVDKQEKEASARASADKAAAEKARKAEAEKARKDSPEKADKKKAEKETLLKKAVDGVAAGVAYAPVSPVGAAGFLTELATEGAGLVGKIASKVTSAAGKAVKATGSAMAKGAEVAHDLMDSNADAVEVAAAAAQNPEVRDALPNDNRFKTSDAKKEADAARKIEKETETVTDKIASFGEKVEGFGNRIQARADQGRKTAQALQDWSVKDDVVKPAMAAGVTGGAQVADAITNGTGAVVEAAGTARSFITRNTTGRLFELNAAVTAVGANTALSQLEAAAKTDVEARAAQAEFDAAAEEQAGKHRTEVASALETLGGIWQLPKNVRTGFHAVNSAIAGILTLAPATSTVASGAAYAVDSGINQVAQGTGRALSNVDLSSGTPGVLDALGLPHREESSPPSAPAPVPPAAPSVDRRVLGPVSPAARPAANPAPAPKPAENPEPTPVTSPEKPVTEPPVNDIQALLLRELRQGEVPQQITPTLGMAPWEVGKALAALSGSTDNATIAKFTNAFMTLNNITNDGHTGFWPGYQYKLPAVPELETLAAQYQAPTGSAV